MRATPLGNVRREALARPSSAAATTHRSQEEECPALPLLALPEDVLHMVLRALDEGRGGRLEDGGGDMRAQHQRPGSNPLLPLRAACRALRDAVDAHVSWLTLDIKAEGDLPPLELARLEQQLHTLLPRWPRLEQLSLCMEHTSTTHATTALLSAAAAARPDLPRLALLPNRAHDCRLVPLPARSLRPFPHLRSLTVWSHGSQYALGLGTGIALSETLPLLEELVLLEGWPRPHSRPPNWDHLFDIFDERVHTLDALAGLCDPPVFDLARLHTATNLQRLRIVRHDVQVLSPPPSLRALELCSVALLQEVELFECPSLTKLELRTVLARRGWPRLRTLITQLAAQPQLTSLALEHVVFNVSTLSRTSRGLQSLELIRILHRAPAEPVVLPAFPTEHLTRLLISDPKLDLAAVRHLMGGGRSGVPNENLKNLRYLHLDLPQECLWQLEELSALSGLEHLCVRGLQVPPTLPQEPLPSIPPLALLKRLVLLDLQGNVDIKDNVRLPSLTSLVLSRSSFTRLPGEMFPKLECLMIKELNGEEGIHEISGAPKLRQLGIKYCVNRGELHLKDLPKLEFVQLGYVKPSVVVLSCVPLLQRSNLDSIDIVEL